MAFKCYVKDTNLNTLHFYQRTIEIRSTGSNVYAIMLFGKVKFIDFCLCAGAIYSYSFSSVPISQVNTWKYFKIYVW